MLLIFLLSSTHHHSHFLATTLDFTKTFYTGEALRFTLFCVRKYYLLL